MENSVISILASDIRSKAYMAEHVIVALQSAGRDVLWLLNLDSEELAREYLDMVEEKEFQAV